MVCISVCMWRTGRVQREGCLKAQCTCQSLYGAQRAMLQHHGPQHGKTWGRWVQCSSTTSPFSTQMWGSSGGNGTVWEGAWVHGWNRKAVGGAFGGWERVGAQSCLRREGFGEVGGAGILRWRGKASLPPCHIPLKSKCRGTSPGRSGSVAQRLGRQAVTALGQSPARLAWPLPTLAHPVWPRLTGVRQPTPSGQAGALHSGVPSWSLSRVRNSGSIHRERGPAEMSSCTQASGWGPSGVCCWW